MINTEMQYSQFRIVHPLAFEDETTPIIIPKVSWWYIIGTNILTVLLFLCFPILKRLNKRKYKHDNTI